MAFEHQAAKCDDDIEMSLVSTVDSEPNLASRAGLQLGRSVRVALALFGAAALAAVAKSGGGHMLTTASQSFQGKQSLSTATTVAPPASQISDINQLTGAKGVVPTQPTNPLAPAEDTNDGNKCYDDEEDHLGLCYKTCSLLTNGKAPHRTSGFTCVKSSSFTDAFSPKVEGLVPCKGFDVAGDTAGGGCPHFHGACLVDEEMSLGKCYKKCSILTQSQYPHRTSMGTCCKTTNFIECLNPAEFKMSADFMVGGGTKGDGIKGDSPIHDPIKDLTER